MAVPWYCQTNSGHAHATEWEAENCSELYELLLRTLDYAGVDDESVAYVDEEFWAIGRR